METPPFVERKIDIKPLFELTSPKVSKELTMFLCDREIERNKSSEGIKVTEEQKSRILMMFDENSSIENENELRKELINNIEKKLNNESLSRDEALILNSDRNFLESYFNMIDSWRDPMLGFYNRRGAMEMLNMVFKNPGEILGGNYKKITRSFILYMDFDKLKELNENGGHLTGDLALKEFRNAIEESVRPTDIVIRMGSGSDEVVIIALGGDNDDAKLTDIKMSQRLSEKTIEGMNLTYSAGCDNTISIQDLESVVKSNDIKVFTELFKAADEKCHESKIAGKNQIRFVE